MSVKPTINEEEYSQPILTKVQFMDRVETALSWPESVSHACSHHDLCCALREIRQAMELFKPQPQRNPRWFRRPKT